MTYVAPRYGTQEDPAVAVTVAVFDKAREEKKLLHPVCAKYKAIDVSCVGSWGAA